MFMSLSIYRIAFLLACAAVLSGCSSVPTYSLHQALESANFPSDMFLGVDYLGSDTAFHYFEYKRRLHRDIRFRIQRSEYTPKEQWNYCAWWPERRVFDYEKMILSIAEKGNRFEYRIGNFCYDSPGEIPYAVRQNIRLIYLPSKRTAVSRRALAQLKPYLKNSADIRFIAPISGIRFNPFFHFVS